MRVRTPNSRIITYPDVVVACPPLEPLDERGDTLPNPTIILKVLSDSTESFDRGEKWLAYEEIPSLTDYLLISQTGPRIEHYSRRSFGGWEYRLLESAGHTVSLLEIDCAFSLSDAYEKV